MPDYCFNKNLHISVKKKKICKHVMQVKKKLCTMIRKSKVKNSHMHFLIYYYYFFFLNVGFHYSKVQVRNKGDLQILFFSFWSISNFFFFLKTFKNIEWGCMSIYYFNVYKLYSGCVRKINTLIGPLSFFSFLFFSRECVTNETCIPCNGYHSLVGLAGSCFV